MGMRLSLVVTLGLATCVSSLSFLGCTSAQTAVAPSSAADRCQITVNNSTSSFTANGGSGTLNVSTARDCTWTVASDANWVSISGERSGQGEASVPYAVAANPVPSPRTSTIAVGTQAVQLSQAGAPCRFTLSRSGDSIVAEGGRLSVDVSTLTGCGWSASSAASWIGISSGQSGNASGTVGLTVSANAGPQRVGQVNVAGQSYTVTQNAAPPPAPAPQPTPTPPAPGPSPAPAPTPPSPSPSPSPAPTPTPTPPNPAPKPPAPAPAPTPTHLEGPALLVSGSCPNVSFSIGPTRVSADGSTDYKKGGCKDIKTGRDLKVDGVSSNGAVRATKIEIDK